MQRSAYDTDGDPSSAEEELTEMDRRALRLSRSSMSKIEESNRQNSKRRFGYRRSKTQPNSEADQTENEVGGSEISMGGCVMAFTFLSKAKKMSRHSFADSRYITQSKPGLINAQDVLSDSEVYSVRSDRSLPLATRNVSPDGKPPRPPSRTEGKLKEGKVSFSEKEADEKSNLIPDEDHASDWQMFWEDMIMAPEKRYVNSLLLTVPLAAASALLNWDEVWVFSLNFLAMVPLAALLGDFTEVAASHVGQTLGGLLNATFGNAVEVVVSIQALRADQIRVVQASLMGSVLSNLLLVLGTCFLFGGYNRKEQLFNQTAAKANCSLLLLSSLSLILPTPLGVYYDLDDPQVLIVSRTVSVCLLFMYCQLLYFQLKTHKDLFENDDDDEDEGMSMTASIVGLASVTVIVAIFSGFLVNSIDGFTEQANLSKTFVGIILLPIIGNVVEHIAAVTVAVKDKMELAMGIAVGSGTQVSIFVIPATVVIGWMMGKEMTLLFPTFEISLFIMAIVIVAHAVGQGSSNWLFGSMLVMTYFMIGVAFWFEVVEDYIGGDSD
mmetsp:Transcript_417/g.547  ORF Transcript_417/g.547 Transcript_417/m.547 type:complete len:552 (+) Transcript_417:85-1740(+)